MENKTGKYFKYAIGEIVLVVIGILIALQINDWNENRKNKNLEVDYILRLIEDLEEQDAYMLTFIGYYERVRINAFNAIQHVEHPELALKQPKQSLIHFYQASQIMDVIQRKSTFDELNSSGQLNLIRNKDLRKLVISFYTEDWSYSVATNFNNTYREILRSILPNSIQNDIRLNCGDIYIRTKSTTSVKLPETCEIQTTAETAKIALSMLIKDIEIYRGLNLLEGNLDASLWYGKNIQINLRSLKTQLKDYKKTLNSKPL
jgi:hypothetical protein